MKILYNETFLIANVLPDCTGTCFNCTYTCSDCIHTCSDHNYTYFILTTQCPVGFNSKLLPLPFPTLLLKSPAPILALIATIPFGPALIPSPSKHSFVSLLYSSSILFFLSFLLFLLLDLTPC